MSEEVYIKCVLGRNMRWIYFPAKRSVSAKKSVACRISSITNRIWHLSRIKNRLMVAPQLSPCVPFEERDLFLQGKDTEYCQIGYGTAPNGTGFVCNETYMPGVSGEMLDWWFPWHSVGSDLRYKIWDREDHYFARADRTDYVCNPGVPVHQKTWGVNHYILEDVGNGPDFVKLCFLSPESYGYDTSLIGTDKCESLVCAVGAGNCAAAMTHKWYALAREVVGAGNEYVFHAAVPISYVFNRQGHYPLIKP